MIFMSHPQHGYMNVYTEADAVANEKQGWKRETTEKSVKIPEQKVEAVETVEKVSPVLVEQYFNKFGKKPHHKMLPSTIEAALKE